MENLFEGTFFSSIFGIKEGDFTSPKTTIGEGEIEIGTMSKLEQRIYTFAKSEELKLNQDPDNIKLYSQIKALNKLMWAFISERIETDNNIGIRDGFKIVSISKPECDCPLCTGDLGFGFGPGLRIISFG